MMDYHCIIDGSFFTPSKEGFKLLIRLASGRLPRTAGLSSSPWREGGGRRAHRANWHAGAGLGVFSLDCVIYPERPADRANQSSLQPSGHTNTPTQTLTLVDVFTHIHIQTYINIHISDIYTKQTLY